MKKYFIYILALLLAVPYISSCSDDIQVPNLLTKTTEDTSSSTEDDDIDVSLLKFGFNLNPKAETEDTPNADEALDIYFYAVGKELTDEDDEECPLLNYTEDCYLYTGVYSEGSWMYVPAAWDEDTDKCKMTRVKDNVWKISLTPSIRDWFGSGTTPIEQLGLIIRTTDGTKGIEEDTYVEIQDDVYNGFTPAAIQYATMPSGLEYGINVIDNSTVTLVLYEKDNTNTRNYDYAYVMGDFNNWTRSNTENSQMYYDDAAGCWWITLSGLDASQEYAFQYYMGKLDDTTGEVDKDSELRLADPYAEKILESGDSYIAESTYPSSERVYPDKGAGTVSVFQIERDNYGWAHDDFEIADKNNLMIYELLLRDFSESGDLQGAYDKLDYLQALGITAIELMPVQEFEGNDSWGYNPTFYFALDKAYGTRQMYKKFIDECHRRGIAVIFDIVYNHATGSHTFARLYWDSENNKTASNNPWFNVDAPHNYSVFQDFNHEQTMVREFFKRNLKYLLNEYHVDGFRFDLSKGFTQNPTGNNYEGSSYDETRIAIIRDYYNTIQSVNPNAVMICEHWTEWNEENVLALAGIQCWHKASSGDEQGYYQSGMGYTQNSSFLYLTNYGNPVAYGGWVGFMESHDEERVAYKAKMYGPSAIRDNLTNRMHQLAANAAFCFTVPGPKMIWQFGELGYDETLGTDDTGKTDAKPLHWEYYDDEDRRYLYDVYAKLLTLRKNHPNLFGESTTFLWNVTEDYWTGTSPRTLSLSYGTEKLYVIGNFGDTESTCTLDSDITYDYINGTTLSSTTVTVAAHDFFLGTSFTE